MIDWKSIDIQADLQNSVYYGKEYINNKIRDMKLKLAEDFIDHMQLDIAYIVKISSEYEFGPGMTTQKARFVLSFDEVPQQNVSRLRQYGRRVIVYSKEIESINCLNCGTSILVGRLDLHGDTVVRCSCCGTYHTIQKKG